MGQSNWQNRINKQKLIVLSNIYCLVFKDNIIRLLIVGVLPFHKNKLGLQ